MVRGKLMVLLVKLIVSEAAAFAKPVRLPLTIVAC